MFKDKEAQKKANREAIKRYRARQGITKEQGITVIPEPTGITPENDYPLASHFRPAPKNLKGAKIIPTSSGDGFHEVTVTLSNVVFREAEGKALISGMPIEDWCRRLVIRECQIKRSP